MRLHPLFPGVIFLLFSVIIAGDTSLFYHQKRPFSVPAGSLQNGDLVFRRGRSAESHAILLTGHKSAYSHVGIVTMEGSTAWVIHAVPGENGKGPDYIRRETVADFLTPEKASRFAVYRADFTPDTRNRAAERAYAFFREHRLFDDRYDMDSDDKLYCTELVIKAFRQAEASLPGVGMTELDLIFGKITVMFPGNLIENPHFHLVTLF